MDATAQIIQSAASTLCMIPLCVSNGCLYKKVSWFLFTFDFTKKSPWHFFLPGNNKFVFVQAAVWVTDGVDRCVVGRVSAELVSQEEQLEGRLAQVFQCYWDSESQSKLAYSRLNEGVCVGVLIDKYVEGDKLLIDIVELVDSDIET